MLLRLSQALLTKQCYKPPFGAVFQIRGVGMIIWDGVAFVDVPRAEAEKLIAEDKAQDVSKEDGLSLKYRHQFTGYITREMRAEAPIAPVAEEVEIVQEEVEATAPPFNWEDHREAYKAATGARRASEKAVIQWAKEEGLLT